jgi:hypothetical protein
MSLEISDAMVEAALEAYGVPSDITSAGTGRAARAMRKAISAALAAREAEAGAVSHPTDRGSHKRSFLAGWMRYDTSADCDIERANSEFDAWWPEGDLAASETEAGAVNIAGVDNQVIVAAAEMDSTQKLQPFWLWYDRDEKPSFGRWQKHKYQAPYIRADLVLASPAPHVAEGWDGKPMPRGGVETDWQAASILQYRKYCKLAKAAAKVVEEADRIHDNEPWPVKYRAPWEAITGLRNVLATQAYHGDAPNPKEGDGND